MFLELCAQQGVVFLESVVKGVADGGIAVVTPLGNINLLLAYGYGISTRVFCVASRQTFLTARE